MILNIDSGAVIVFDLDDTLYDEVGFVRSGFHYVAQKYTPGHLKEAVNLLFDAFLKNKDAFAAYIGAYKLNQKNITKNKLLNDYRLHFPDIKVREGVLDFMSSLKKHNIKTGLITDGRSVTQRNKISALGLNNCFDMVVISEEFGSEKPSPENYKVFQKAFSGNRFIYFGDNPAKDFVAPNALGWLTIGVRSQGHNIHVQNTSLRSSYLPSLWINSFKEVCLTKPA